MENRIKTDKSSELKSNAEMFMNLLAHGKKPIIEVRKNNKSYTRTSLSFAPGIDFLDAFLLRDAESSGPLETLVVKPPWNV